MDGLVAGALSNSFSSIVCVARVPQIGDAIAIIWNIP